MPGLPHTQQPRLDGQQVAEAGQQGGLPLQGRPQKRLSDGRNGRRPRGDRQGGALHLQGQRGDPEEECGGAWGRPVRNVVRPGIRYTGGFTFMFLLSTVLTK